MNKMTKYLALALALLFVVSGSAEASKVKAKSKAKAQDGRAVRSAVIKNYKAKSRSTNVRVHLIGASRSGKSAQVAVETKGSGKVRTLNVRKSNGVAYETPTKSVSQSTARGAAHQKLRRQSGSYSGTSKSGLSKSGKSYRFNSKTDRSAKTGDATYVNVKTGKTYTRVKGE